MSGPVTDRGLTDADKWRDICDYAELPQYKSRNVGDIVQAILRKGSPTSLIARATPEEAEKLIVDALRRLGSGFHASQSQMHGGGEPGAIDDVKRIVGALRVLLST